MAATYGERILAAREKAGLGQRKFGRLLGVGYATVQNWEHGRREPSGPYKQRLDQLLSQVVGGGEPPPAVSL